MLRGLKTLTWIEFKIFMREPMGSVSALVFPVVLFLVLGMMPSVVGDGTSSRYGQILVPLPVMAIVFIGLSNVTSLITIIAIYRESGILKRLRSTPLKPYTILTAHVLVKLSITALSLALLMFAGRSLGAIEADLNVFSFVMAIVFSFTCLMSIGFVIASLVPTARFAQPLATFILVPMMIFSPIFMPIDDISNVVVVVLANLSPMNHVVHLLEGVWQGGTWADQLGSILALITTFILALALSTRIFRWE